MSAARGRAIAIAIAVAVGAIAAAASPARRPRAFAGSGSGSGANEMIALATATLAIVTPPTADGSATIVVTSAPAGTDQLASATLTTADARFFAFPGLIGCTTPQQCDLATPLALPYTLVVACTPTASGERDTMLEVVGTSGTHATALVTCIPSTTNGPVAQLSAATLAIPTPIPVGSASAPARLAITNAGSGTLTASVDIPAPADLEWSASACTATAPCSLVGHGSAATVDVTFAPTVHGDRGATMTVTTNDPSHARETVALVGTGYGGVLELVSPADATLAFGTIPAAQTSTIDVVLRDSGNAPIAATVAAPAAPFAAAPTMLALAPEGGTATFQATCGGPPHTGSADFTIASDAYTPMGLALHATCTTVDAPITITPPRFAFGELRVGDPPATIAFDLANTSTGDVTISALEVVGAAPGLALDPSAPTPPIVLHAGEQLASAVTLHATADVVIADDSHLAVEVDGVMLALPIGGRVVTPHARVSPIELDLGTTCVGTPVAGTVRLINDGTATLAMSAPQVPPAFVVVPTSPTTYPAPLAVAGVASVEVVPAATAAGALRGALAWPVDVPAAPFTVPIDLDVIDAGAAVSPRRHDFDALPVATRSDGRTITVQNCNPDPIVVAVQGVVGDDDSAASAWQLEPAMAQRTLLPHATMKLLVHFAPTTVGTYHAHVALVAAGVETDVALTGRATGTQPPTGFYACGGCATGAPYGAWPIALAWLIAIARTRRRVRHISPRT